jgi:hypothetical protein
LIIQAQHVTICSFQQARLVTHIVEQCRRRLANCLYRHTQVPMNERTLHMVVSSMLTIDSSCCNHASKPLSTRSGHRRVKSYCSPRCIITPIFFFCFSCFLLRIGFVIANVSVDIAFSLAVRENFVIACVRSEHTKLSPRSRGSCFNEISADISLIYISNTSLAL